MRGTALNDHTMNLEPPAGEVPVAVSYNLNFHECVILEDESKARLRRVLTGSRKRTSSITGITDAANMIILP